MGQQDPVVENKRFGLYLRRIREERRLSLDAVEEMSGGFPERLSKSHLSRIENGHAVPTFPRIFALSQIYGIPITSLAERFEIDLTREMLPPEIASRPRKEILEHAQRLRMEGRYAEELVLYDAILDRYAEPGEEDRAQLAQISLQRINCLVHLARYAAAKDECEDILGMPALSPEHRVDALHCFAICCYRLSKFTFALMALETAEQELKRRNATGRQIAYLAALRGTLLDITGDKKKSIEYLKKAIEHFEELQIPLEACRAELNLASTLIAVGERKEARRLLEKARAHAQAQGYERLLALAISTLALLAFEENDLEAAEACCLRSNAIARPREYVSVIFRNCYYLWRIAKARGDQAGVSTNERTLRSYLSRVEEFLPEAQDYRARVTGGQE